MDEKARQRLIYVETCRYVDRVQEGLNEVMSVQTWERLVSQVQETIKHALSAGASPDGD